MCVLLNHLKVTYRCHDTSNILADIVEDIFFHKTHGTIITNNSNSYIIYSHKLFFFLSKSMNELIRIEGHEKVKIIAVG